MQPMDIFIGKLIKFIRNDCRWTDNNAKEGKKCKMKITKDV